jgi:hypothetical protein
MLPRSGPPDMAVKLIVAIRARGGFLASQRCMH